MDNLIEIDIYLRKKTESKRIQYKWIQKRKKTSVNLCIGTKPNLWADH